MEKKGSAREKEGHNNDKIGVSWAWDTDGIQAGGASARGNSERGNSLKCRNEIAQLMVMALG